MKLGITKLNKELAMKKTIALLACAFTATGVFAKLPAPTPEQAAADTQATMEKIRKSDRKVVDNFTAWSK